MQIGSYVGFPDAILPQDLTSLSCQETEGARSIDTRFDHQRQGALLVGLANLVESNRLTLVVLAANVAGAGTRARDAAAESLPARWLARNARALLLFLASLSFLPRCAGQAGYRAIRAISRPYRRKRAPRLLRHRLDQRAVVRVDRALGMVRERPRFVVSLC